MLSLGGVGCGKRSTPAAKAAEAAFPFTEIARGAGVDFQHLNGQSGGANIVETTGSGCGVFDYDNDGWLDLFLVNGKSPPADGCRLYRNNRDGTFRDVTAETGVSGPRNSVGMGCATGDYDQDGHIDLYVTYWGKNVLFRNLGNGRFQDVTASAGVAVGGFSTAAALADLDTDGWPDLYVARYCEFNQRSKQLCQNQGVPTSCPPYYYPAEPDVVFKNLGNGRFRDVTREWGMTEKTGRGLGVCVVDYNRDGRLDLFVANDGSANFLYQKGSNQQWSEVASREGIALNDTGAAVANMGCDFGDFLGDGTLGATTGVFQNEVQPVWRYQPGVGFQQVTLQVGLQTAATPFVTFGLGFSDLDNDGWLDLFQANGHVQDRIAQIDKNCTYPQTRSFFRNTGQGTFEDLTTRCGPALREAAVGRGVAFGDLDNDGDIDLLVSNNNGRAMLLRNDHPPQNWVQLRLINGSRNWEAAGAEVELHAGGRKFLRYVRTSGSYASANDPRVHIGLGKIDTVERILIRWPDGTRTEHPGVPINRITPLLRPSTRPPAALEKLLVDGR